MMIILGTVWGFVPKKSDSVPFAVQLQTIEDDKVEQEFSGEIWGQIRTSGVRNKVFERPNLEAG